MRRPQPETRHTAQTGRTAFYALRTTRRALDYFLGAIAPEIATLQLARGLNVDPTPELDYLREIITEHLRNQFPHAIEAATEWFPERDPLKKEG